MTLYEVQVLDSYNNPTYADGQAAAVYGQHPPLVNASFYLSGTTRGPSGRLCASCKPGEWQTYDIAFDAPRFEGDKLVKPGYVTVFQNGVLVQDHAEIWGETLHRQVGKYSRTATCRCCCRTMAIPTGIGISGSDVSILNHPLSRGQVE